MEKLISLNRHQNNFDLIRFIAATFVIFKHSNAILGVDEYWFLDYNLPFLGVPIFFTISGYLILTSAIYSKSSINYFWKRSLRIFPGLIIALIFTVLVIGLLDTKLNWLDYLANPQSWKHLISASLYKLELNLPGVFVDNKVTEVNGSLWTLKYEFSCYVIIFLLFKVLNKKLLKYGVLFVWIALLGVRFYLGDKINYYNYSFPLLLNHNFKFVIEWGIYFFSGGVFFYLKDFLNLNFKLFALATIIYLILYVFLLDYVKYYQYFYIPLMVFYLGLLKGKTNSFGKYGDFSYGLYIYAFPVQQLLCSFFDSKMEGAILSLLTLLIVLPLSFLSWRLIEKPALAFKNKL